MKRISILTVGMGLAMGQSAFAEEELYVNDPNVVMEAPVANGAYTANETGSGFLQATVGRVTVSDQDADLAGIRGSYSMKLGSMIEVQGDVEADFIVPKNNTQSGLSATVHVFHRNPDSFATGVFGNFNQVSGDVDDVNSYKIGLEQAYFSDNVTLIGQAGWGETEAEDDDYQEYKLKLASRFYVSDNARLEIAGSYAEAEVGELDIAGLRLSVGGTYRFENRPFSVFGAYRYENVEVTLDNDTGSADASAVFAGVRYHFGSSSLKHEERTGTLWSPLDGLFQ